MELKASHIRMITLLLDGLYGEWEHDSEEINVRLAMIHHGDDPRDKGKADRLLDGPADDFTAYAAPVLVGPAIPFEITADGNSAELTHEGQTWTVKGLKGRQWRLALPEANRFDRMAAMTGMTRAQVLDLPLVVFNAVERAIVPFVSPVLENLMTGGGLSGGSSEPEDSASETSSEPQSATSSPTTSPAGSPVPV